MNFVRVKGVTLHYETAGRPSARALLFINSLGSDLRIWDDIVPHFVDDYYVVRFDKRGHGLSDSPPRPYAIHDFSRDVAGLLDHLHIKQTTLVGVSVGGMIALDFAAHNPQRVAALVLCDTAARLGTADYWNERITAIETQGMAQMAEPILSRWFAPDFAQKHSDAYRGYSNLLTRTDVNGYLGTCAALRDADLNGPVAGIHQPVLVLCGAEDVATPPDVVRELADSLPNGRFQTIPGAGHTPSVEQPQTMAALISQFLEETYHDQ